MNRNNEYLNLINELDSKSEKIDNLYKKANKKLIKRRIITGVTSTLSTVASLLIIFIILINNVHSFAYACGGVPILKGLAKFVAKSPSLSAAVEHQYVQPIEISKAQNDITATVEYIIVDQKQVNIFYSLKSEKYKSLQLIPNVLNENRENLDCSVMFGDTIEKNDLKMITLDFIDKNVPDYILLKLKVKDNSENIEEIIENEIVNENTDNDVKDDSAPEILAEFEIDLKLDPNYTAQGEIINLNKSFKADEQTLTITTVEIYPTHVRINFDANEENTKWLTSLNFRIEDENGNKFDKVSNGITSTGDIDSPMMASHRLESTYFSRSKELTLYIESITWLDKDKEKIKIDIKNNQYDTLPDDVKLYNIEKDDNGYNINFIVTSDKINHSFINFSHTYYDVDDNEYHMSHISTFSSLYNTNDEKIKGNLLKENQFVETLYLTGYDKDIVYVLPLYTNTYKLDNPIKIKIK